MNVVIRLSRRARFAYLQWSFLTAVVFASGIGWALGARAVDAVVWTLFIAALAVLLAPTLFMRVVIDDQGLRIRNYFRSANVAWDEIAEIVIARPPAPSPMRRPDWVLEIRCRDGRRLTAGALLNSSPGTIAQLAAALHGASAKFGFAAPDDLQALRR